MKTRGWLAVSVLIVGWLIGTPALVNAEPIEIEHFISQAHGQPVFEVTKKIAEVFNSKQNRIKVTVTMNPGGTYEEKVLTRLAAGTPPDVITSNRYSDLAPRGVLYPLTKFAERDGLIDKLIPTAVEFATWDGELLLLPQTTQPFVTYYNIDLFNDAGLIDPYNQSKSGNWTWEAVMASARRITADRNKDGTPDIWGMALNCTYLQRTVLWVLQAGGTYFDKWVNPTRATFTTSPGVATAFTFIHNLVHENNAIPVAAALTTATGDFSKGKVGMLFEGLWQIGNSKSAGFRDYNVAPVAKGPVNAGTVVQFDGMQLVNGSKNPEAAWEWMHYLITDPQAYTMAMEATGRPPTLIKALPTYIKMMQEGGVPSNVTVLMDAIMNPIMAPCIPAVANVTPIMSAFSTEIRKYINNQQSLQATLELINQNVDRLIKEATGPKK